MVALSLPWKITNPYVVAAIATVGGMMFGFDISSVSAFLGVPSYENYFHNPQATLQSGITSAMPAGSFAGSIVSGHFSDRFGRRAAIQLASWFWMIGAAIQCSSQNVPQLVAGRVISGVGVGLASSQVPVFIAELSPKNIRGRLVGCFQLSVTLGILIMFYICYGLGKIHGTAAWRISWGIQIVPGMFLFIGTLFLNESPRWLASKDRWEEAINIIAHIQANGDRDNDQVRIEVEEIKEAVRATANNKTGYIGMFKGKTNFRRTTTGIFTQIWQQLCGMNVIMYYVVRVFEMAGYTGNVGLVSSSIQYILNVVMTFLALPFIDKLGRRPVLLVGAAAMFTWLFASAGIFAQYSNPLPNGFKGDNSVKIIIPKSRPAAQKAAIAASYLFVCSFAPTWGPCCWVYVSEIFPLEQRAIGNGICAAANWAFNFAIGMFTLPAFSTITWKTYCVFGTFCGVMFFHVLFLFPETNGKTLEEIDAMWQANIPAWRTANWQPPVADLEAIKAHNGGRAPSLKNERVHKEDIGDSNSSISEMSIKA